MTPKAVSKFTSPLLQPTAVVLVLEPLVPLVLDPEVVGAVVVVGLDGGC